MTRATDGAVSLRECPFCGTVMRLHDHCFSHPKPNDRDCILRHYSFDKQKARDWNHRHDAQRELIEALEWAMGRVHPIRLIRGQNDEIFAAYERARALLTKHRPEPTDAELVDQICRAAAEALKPLPGEASDHA